MKFSTVICVTFSSVLLCACSQSSVDVEAEQAALRAAADAYHAAGEALDADTFADFYTSDGLIFPPNEQSVSGRDGAHNFISTFAETPGAGVSFSDANVVVAASGDMGYTLADAVVSFEGPDGEPEEDKIRDFHLWKKQDGEWKIAIDIWNSELPLLGATAGGTDSDVAGVQAWSDAMLAAQAAGDVDASMDLLTDDAVGMPSDAPILGGADAWRTYWENLYSGVSLEPALSDEEYRAGGDWGFVSGTWTVSVAAEEEGEPQRTAANFVVVVHREDVGVWKLARVIWHPAQPATEE
ncbi:MAG: DUF4440 domain-containing protein [Proteobacteria bacterium]|nr:DUF4440 domain-containing protein [Pseudomonadota bacterium]